MTELTSRLEPEQIRAIARAVADPGSYAILQEIASHNELPSSELHARDRRHPATISHHIRELQRAGLIRIASDRGTSRLSLARNVWRAYVRELSHF